MPPQETFEGTERRTRYEYPPIAIRELFANAIIHQDLTQTGMNVSIEVFNNRVIINNPGKMLIDCDRVVNATPVSRNEKIARTMRRIGLCEELGSGWDRIVESCEEYRLPSPMVRCDENSTTVVLSGKRSLNEMSTDDKIWSCYLHTCALHARGLRMTNSSLRSRFGIDDSNSGSVISSRIIKDAKKKGLIKVFDETAAPKNISYIPYWA